ncbi:MULTISPECIES: polynucleotide adenylyltransferase PcnB [unclassified Rhizobacter]|uniref:polynucleotide adenylyltransferase PcnB n=1 Tax=unclassified Rhizobacter TaxID=2640088 RepID=UPI0006F55A87|nr:MULTISPECIES: polynucleotide adenylyltransferase PcnB [unclassified Rhizobacter]KQU71241.1 poly(A) polymerase [Rhizobacter sp. Root29]KQV97074.1 poly(A) polymerase [Rhizobacter sp. Root1238]KRB24146.1 poly(A) polymerase [Rhizobacter sp. Root16D2]
MIKKFIDKLLGKTSTPIAVPKGKRVEVPASEHGIDPALVDENAVRVVQTLADAGYEAYIVGGAVRDLLVGLRPKDFDVATNATPEQVKGLFRRAFIIGRRFRIVHVVFGRGREHEVIEVSTFRAMMDAAASEQVSGNEKTSKSELAGKTHAVDASGRVLRDNVWGPQIEDAARRDFTVNAMYYDPQRQIVVDYHGGIKDAKKKVLRIIGDPVTRYREDPVRIIRVVRFAAKLGFTIDPKTRAPIRELAALLDSVPASRTFDEMIKLLQTGHALASIEELHKQGLAGAARGLFPILDVMLDDAQKHPARQKFVQLALADTDRRVAESKPVAPSFMLACMLWHEVLDRWLRLKKGGEAPFPALQQAIDAVFDARIGDISGRGKLAGDMREIWLMQPRFERRTGNGPFTLVEQPRFRAAFDFLRLRADAGEIDAELARWWEDFSLADPDERHRLMQGKRDGSRDGPREAPRRSSGPRAAAATRDPAPAKAGDAAEADDATDAVDGDLSAEPARKRRRRRRKPGGGDSGGAPAAGGDAGE